MSCPSARISALIPATVRAVLFLTVSDVADRSFERGWMFAQPLRARTELGWHWSIAKGLMPWLACMGRNVMHCTKLRSDAADDPIKNLISHPSDEPQDRDLDCNFL
jgi:hypothetical protein